MYLDTHFCFQVQFTQNKALLACGMVWAMGAVLEFVLTGYSSKPMGDVCGLYIAYPSHTVQLLSSILRYIFTLVLPVILMICCYWKMVNALKQVGPNADAMSAADRSRQLRHQRVRRNLIKTLLIVCVAYVLCVGWNQTYFFFINIGISLHVTTVFYYFTVYAQFSNCLINPIIYTAKYREFQISAKKMFSCFFKRNNQVSDVSVTKNSQVVEL